MMVDYYNASFASLHVRVSNRAALHMYKENLGFEILGIEKGYYADKEDAFKMKKYFKEEEKQKEASKIIQLSSDVNWEDIKDTYEEVDINGEEKSEVKEETKETTEDTDAGKDEDTKKKKKKKNKKK
jgi:hypothetical protein